MDDGHKETSIIGRDTDAEREARAAEGAKLAEQLNATTSEAGGAAVTGTAPEPHRDLDIVFERDDPDQ